MRRYLFLQFALPYQEKTLGKDMFPHDVVADTITLVVGGTGTQGGAVAWELLTHGHRVRLFVRNPEAAAAKRLAEYGAEVVQGDLNALDSIAAAMRGISRVFSVQVGDPTGGNGEQRQAKMLVAAAVDAKVQHFVQSSVAGIEPTPRPDAPPSLVMYWAKKQEIEGYVQNGGFPSWTILRPAWVMENLLGVTAQFMFPFLVKGEIFTALKPETQLDMVAAADIATFARLAMDNPQTFSGKIVELAGDSVSMVQVANTISRVTGKNVVSIALSPANAVEKGLHPSVVASQDYRNDVGFQIDIEKLKRYGLSLTSWELWANQHKEQFLID